MKRYYSYSCFGNGAEHHGTASGSQKAGSAKAQQSNADNMTLRAKLYFPTAIPMDEDVVWRRDIYRELNLTDDANAALYYPVEPTDGKMNLFTYIFKLMFTGRVPVYQYRMDGNEDFLPPTVLLRKHS